ncbi:15.4 kDa class V heat shock protein [Silene latifolia]|uniref:15.4 kDa class V heat shock protein n=1 Tax=Silene latifolia TaxID=37657 RepID=UPI003D784DFC
MELVPYHQDYPWDILLHPSMFIHQFQIPENYVHWRETPESHIYSADLPGVRKEEVKVEVEDSMYLIIRTENAANESSPPSKRFMRKFRLPVRVDIEGISAGYEDGVLTVTVPRRILFTNLAGLAGRLHVTASAA